MAGNRQKILRIGIVQDRNIVQEQLIRKRQTVTVGESTKNTFVFPPCSLPKRFPIFVFKGNNYFLQFTEGMSGKVSVKGAVSELEDLRQRGEAVKRGSAWVLPLTEASRGKVSVDNISVLFQFVPAPPEPLKGVVKYDFKPKLIEEGDPVFLGFIGLFSVIMGIFTIYAHNVEFPEVTQADIPDRFARLLVPEDTSEPDEVVEPDEALDGDGPGEGDEPDDEPEETAEDDQPEDTEPEEQAPVESAEDRAAREALEKAQREEALRQSVEDSPLLASLKLLGTTGDNNAGGAVGDPFASNDFAGERLNAAAANVDSLEVASGSQLNVRGEEGGTRTTADIGELEQGGGGTTEISAGPTVAVEGNVDLAAADLVGEGDEEAVRRVVRRYKGQIKYCYDNRLKENPDLSGRVEIEFTIGRGRVLEATVFGNTTGDSALADCIKRKVERWTFDREVEMDVVYPFVLTK